VGIGLRRASQSGKRVAFAQGSPRPLAPSGLCPRRLRGANSDAESSVCQVCSCDAPRLVPARSRIAPRATGREHSHSDVA
jgi:hypothetical protein